MKKHRTQKEKEDLIQLYKASGLTRVMFCKEHHIAPTSLRNWMKYETTKPIKFLQVTESPTEKVELNALADNIKIEFRGVAVSFSKDTAASYIGEVIKVIAYV